jgi:putative ABC transport system permease protein
LDTQRTWVQFQNAWRMAIDSIIAHKLRSALTLLGVIIGVASVVIVGAAINGLGAYAEESTAKAFGAESFAVAQVALSGNFSRHEFFNKLKRNKRIMETDARFVEAVAGDRVFYSPSVTRGGVDLKRENLLCQDASLIGVAADMADIRDISVVEGRFFTEQEERSAARVAMIGDEVRATLFPGAAEPVGAIIRVDGQEFTVVGVQEKLGAMFGQTQDRTVYIPIGTFARMFGLANGFTLYGRPRPDSGMTLMEALDATRVALRAHFHVPPGEPDNFDVQTPEAIRGFIDQVIGIIAAAIVPLTSISLLVGGIVIMNIMLISVTERTSEIGLRKAVGARHSDLMMQILIESVALSVAGGVIGLGFGAIVTALLARWLEVPLSVSMGYVTLALGVSSTVGIVSGWYPALRAARLDPVVALRAE